MALGGGEHRPAGGPRRDPRRALLGIDLHGIESSGDEEHAVDRAHHAVTGRLDTEPAPEGGGEVDGGEDVADVVGHHDDRRVVGGRPVPCRRGLGEAGVIGQQDVAVDAMAQGADLRGDVVGGGGGQRPRAVVRLMSGGLLGRHPEHAESVM